jgi:hypothetical protein
MTNKQQGIIEAAIIGLQAQSARLKAKITDLRSQLDGRTASTPAERSPGPRWKMSAAAKRRISQAQRRRWALIRKRAMAA